MLFRAHLTSSSMYQYCCSVFARSQPFFFAVTSQRIIVSTCHAHVNIARNMRPGLTTRRHPRHCTGLSWVVYSAPSQHTDPTSSVSRAPFTQDLSQIVLFQAGVKCFVVHQLEALTKYRSYVISKNSDGVSCQSANLVTCACLIP